MDRIAPLSLSPRLFALSLLLATACSNDGESNKSGNPDPNAPDARKGTSEFGPDGAPNPDVTACKKIDLVFSVDPSRSMAEELEEMSETVFPQFAAALRDVGGGLEDYRISVIEGCPTPATFHTSGNSQTDCGFESGEAWMTSESSALTTEFSCVGDIDQTNTCTGDNDDEQPIAAAIASLTPPESTGANANFLRDDALLVVVTITDEDECPAHLTNCNDTSDATAKGIYDDLVAIKGDVRKMVYLGISGGTSGCANGVYGSAAPAPLVSKIVSLFVAEDRGVAWNLCDGKLENGLVEALSVIEQACRELPQID